MDDNINICRICLTEDGKFQSIFFSNKKIGKLFAEMIMSYASVQIAFGDGLPSQICSLCSAKVLEMYVFKKLCEESDISLRAKLKKSPLHNPGAGSDFTSDFNLDVKNEVLIKPEASDIINLEENSESCELVEVTDTSVKLQKPDFTNNVKSEDMRFSDSETNVGGTINELSLQEKPMLHTPTFEGFRATITSDMGKQKTDNECSICNRKFSKPSHLTRHLMTVHSNLDIGAKQYVCEICLKGVANLRDHMRTHNGEKPYLCSTCGKGFNQLGNLRQHTIRHSGVKPFVCTFCNRGFASNGELGAHLRKHTGARPFVCSICNHGFTTSSSLTKHKRIHSGEKPYECNICHVRFSRSGVLTMHKRIHTGEKPYVCKYCLKAFAQKNDLISHLRIHTGEKPYVCDICGTAFRQNSTLKTHKKTHADRSLILESKAKEEDADSCEK